MGGSNMKIKILSKKDTDRIAIHMHIVYELLSKFEDEYGDVSFNTDAKMFNEDILCAAGAVERVYNNTNTDSK